MPSDLTIHGLDKTQAALKQLPDKLAERLVRLSLRQGANLMARYVRAAAPVKTGRLKKAIRVGNSKINTLRKNGQVGVYVTIKKGRSRKDPKGAYYAPWVENGYDRGSRQITGRQAVLLGVVSQERLNAKRAQVAAKRRIGRVKQGIRYRHGGAHVPGQHFIRDAYTAHADQCAGVIVQASGIAADQAAKTLGF